MVVVEEDFLQLMMDHLKKDDLVDLVVGEVMVVVNPLQRRVESCRKRQTGPRRGERLQRDQLLGSSVVRALTERMFTLRTSAPGLFSRID